VAAGTPARHGVTAHALREAPLTICVAQMGTATSLTTWSSTTVDTASGMSVRRDS
jgi:hypothetical protein